MGGLSSKDGLNSESRVVEQLAQDAGREKLATNDDALVEMSAAETTTGG